MNTYTPPKFFLYLLFSVALLCMVKGCASCHAQMITEGVNKGLTVEQVTQYRIAGIAAIAKDAQSKLSDAQNETASAKLALAGVQKNYDTVLVLRDWWQKDDEAHIAGENFWRKRAQVVLYALAICLGFWFYKDAQKMCVSPASGWIGLVVPFAAWVAGAALGYVFGLYALGWIAQFLP